MIQDAEYTPVTAATGRYIGLGFFVKGAQGQHGRGCYYVKPANRPAWLVEGRWYALRAEDGLYLVEGEVKG